MSSQRNRRLAPVAAAVLMALYGTADAQDTPGQESSPRTLPKVRVEAAAEGYATEAISTATKTETPLLEVPQSISVITHEQILAGGELKFTLQAAPDKTWGRAAAARPYSMSGEKRR